MFKFAGHIYRENSEVNRRVMGCVIFDTIGIKLATFFVTSMHVPIPLQAKVTPIYLFYLFQLYSIIKGEFLIERNYT